MDSSSLNLIVIASLVLLALLLWFWMRQRIARPGGTVLEIDNYQFRPADFDPGSITEIELPGLTVYVGNGSFTNNSGQTLLISVAAASDKNVIDYFDMARFHFEIRGQSDLPIPSERPKQVLSKPSDISVQQDSGERPIQTSSKRDIRDEKSRQEPPELSIQELLKAKNGNVHIDFDLSPDTIKSHPQGRMFIVVDPKVEKDRFTNYRSWDPSNNRATATIAVSTGIVEGSLYRNCEPIPGQTEIRWSSPRPKELTGSGSGYFDLTVKGIGTGVNKYTLSWDRYYSEERGPSSQGRARIDCGR